MHASPQVEDGISEAESGYTRRLTAAKMQGRSIEEMEKNQARNVFKEVKKRVQLCHEELRMLCRKVRMPYVLPPHATKHAINYPFFRSRYQKPQR